MELALQTKTNVPEKAKINLLESIENIIELAEASNLENQFYSTAKEYLQELSEELNISANQALIFSTLVNYCTGCCIYIKDLARFFKCKEIKLLRMDNDFKALKEKNLIQIKQKKDETYYSIKKEVMQALKDNEIYNHIEHEICTLRDWFDRLVIFTNQVGDYDMEACELSYETLRLLEDYPKFEFIKKITQLKFSEFDTLLLIYVCHLFVNNDDDHILFRDLEDYFDASETWKLKGVFRKKTGVLFEKNLIEWVAETNMGHAEAIKLTDSAKEDLLKELGLDLKSLPSKKDFILSGNLVEKPLFYNEKEEQQILDLQKLLSPNHFQTVRQRLEERGMQEGFSCLFYGGPGTGKTESVYQLAKQTNRDILRVDISNTKSMWFGESEKKIKEVFTRYKTYLKLCETAPILLFNEADAVLGKRKDVSGRGTAQTENAIQNIILQEMESFSGILIATTNLTTNLDSAFERRFIYKIKFEQPAITVKQKIWQSKLSWLSEEESLRLAQQFDFSGGEIENIARKSTVNEIIFGDTPQFADIEKLCSAERIVVRASIGFR